MTDLSIIITNLNGIGVIRDCIDSVVALTREISYEVIVVDDGSTDGSTDLVRSSYPDVRLIVNEKNVGFSEANNIGMRAAHGRYMVLLNNDTILQNNAFGILVRYMDANPDVAIAGGMLVNRLGKPDLSYGSFPSLTEALHTALFLDKLFPQARWLKQRGTIPSISVTAPLDVDYICGADFVIRREIVAEYGYLDTLFHAYCEETDYCYRVRKSGRWRITYVPEARIMHLISNYWGSYSERRVRSQQTSYHKYFLKHHNGWYDLAVRCLHAWRYLVIIGTNIVRMALGIGDRNLARNIVTESRWIVKYSLRPPKDTR